MKHSCAGCRDPFWDGPALKEAVEQEEVAVLAANEPLELAAPR